jgi:hypothetical protein
LPDAGPTRDYPAKSGRQVNSHWLLALQVKLLPSAGLLKLDRLPPSPWQNASHAAKSATAVAQATACELLAQTQHAVGAGQRQSQVF